MRRCRTKPSCSCRYHRRLHHHQRQFHKLPIHHVPRTIITRTRHQTIKTKRNERSHRLPSTYYDDMNINLTRCGVYLKTSRSRWTITIVIVIFSIFQLYNVITNLSIQKCDLRCVYSVVIGIEGIFPSFICVDNLFML